MLQKKRRNRSTLRAKAMLKSLPLRGTHRYLRLDKKDSELHPRRTSMKKRKVRALRMSKTRMKRAHLKL